MKTNVINGQISVTDAKAKVRMEEVQKIYADLKDADGDSDVEPELIKAAKAVKVTKAPKEVKPPRIPKASKPGKE